MGIAKRYATAVFEIVKENGRFPKLEASLDMLSSALEESAELRDLLNNPVYSRTEQEAAITALVEKMGLIVALQQAMKLMAQKRRLFVVPQMVTCLREMLAQHKGEISAEVTSATPLSDAQTQSLAATLKERLGKEVKINAAVDESLIGGLVVKVGSKMIDTSIRSKLASLQNVMKEVG